MKHTKKAIVSVLILFTFIGNIGFRVFTHSCQEDGVFRSYFVELQDHCDEEPIKKLPPCCQKAQTQKSAEKQFKKDCCNDEVDVYKVNMNYFSDNKLTIPALIYVANFNPVPIAFISVDLVKLNQAHYFHAPPILSGRDILIRNQVFRI